MCVLAKYAYRAFCLLIVLQLYSCMPNTCKNDDCNRCPQGTKFDPLRADGRFILEVQGTGDKYLPRRNYTVRLYAKDGESSFIAYTIAAANHEREVNRPNLQGRLFPGRFVALPYSDAEVRPDCPATIFQKNDTVPKTSVEVLWSAPLKNNECLTIYAYVAVKPNIWYNSQEPLSKSLCEDKRKAEDLLPAENDHCTVCEDARYQVTFEGLWSYNTHAQMFPERVDTAGFSEMVGASHSKNYNLYTFNSDASEGLQRLATEKNTSLLEIEILRHLVNNVRTLIKANAPARSNGTTGTSFRASQKFHLMSLVTAIKPSPDWFLGVSNLELCDSTNNWAKRITLNMYPLDAGVDGGTTFEASEPMKSHTSVSSAPITKTFQKPFGKLTVELVRTYRTSECADTTIRTSIAKKPKHRSREKAKSTTSPPTTPSEDDITENPDEKCPMTPWGNWSLCEGKCVNGKIIGIETRFRNHIVNGKVVMAYDSSEDDVEIPEICVKTKADSDYRTCEEPCEEQTEGQINEETKNEAQQSSWKVLDWFN